jgi:hypothetical protein
MIKAGDKVACFFTVTAVHTQKDDDGRTRGVALGYDERKREFGVWLINEDDVHTGVYTSDAGKALSRYAERVTIQLHTYSTHAKTFPANVSTSSEADAPGGVPCNCEHESHFDDEPGQLTEHPYMLAAAGNSSATYLGSVCDTCAQKHVKLFV